MGAGGASEEEACDGAGESTCISPARTPTSLPLSIAKEAPGIWTASGAVRAGADPVPERLAWRDSTEGEVCRFPVCFALVHVCLRRFEALWQALQLASARALSASVDGVTALCSQPVPQTGVVGDGRRAASGEGDRERLRASGARSRASMERVGTVRSGSVQTEATPTASETEKSKPKHQIGSKKGSEE